MATFYKSLLKPTYNWFHALALRLDKRFIKRGTNVDHIPTFANRRGGKSSYGEWAHTIGIFQTLLGIHTAGQSGLQILDVGCGTGLLAVASYPLLLDGGHYTGIDVQQADIDFCKRHYPADLYTFIHLDTVNAFYAPQQSPAQQRWDIADNSMDVVTALSVWTHFNEADAIFYFNEVNRVLKPGGTALITFFLLDETDAKQRPQRREQPSRFHKTPETLWIFDQVSSPSANWYHTRWAVVPESAIGVSPAGIEMLQAHTQLEWAHTYSGNWKEEFGTFFQDVLVFKKQTP